jgi:acyl-coenzyme A synthetase/AMP-(fatty) acid ligase
MPGDYAYKDDEGYFWYLSRSDDLIKTRSYRIDPNEVEAAICEYARIKEAAVIGLPDEMRGQRPLAYAVPFDPIRLRLM